ncbi:hypothetical protein B566_EDAN008057 [Ephemera danica]|nr:hypothetical protein B566_EDAN008057 [Ephemera danica]
MLHAALLFFFALITSCTTEDICLELPITPVNSAIRCRSYRLCEATCRSNYEFPTGEVSVSIACFSGTWKLQSTQALSIPDCKPVCNPRCRNEGLCVAHNTCSCKPQYAGAYCENEVQQRYTSAQLICNSFPTTPINSRKTCNSRQCTIQCVDNYQFPDGSAAAQINCQNGQWIAENRAWSTIPDCQAVCNPRCQNEGVCILPNTCVCNPRFFGAHCENEAQICSSFPSTPLNSRRSCDSRQCTVQCVENHQLPDGRTTAYITCQAGRWIPDNRAWSTVPDCQPVCNPPCRNGGRCWASNTCQCIGNFKGPQCQYAYATRHVWRNINFPAELQN